MIFRTSGAADCAHPHETKIRIEIEKEIADKYFRMLAPCSWLTSCFTIQIRPCLDNLFNFAEQFQTRPFGGNPVGLHPKSTHYRYSDFDMSLFNILTGIRSGSEMLFVALATTSASLMMDDLPTLGKQCSGSPV